MELKYYHHAKKLYDITNTHRHKHQSSITYRSFLHRCDVLNAESLSGKVTLSITRLDPMNIIQHAGHGKHDSKIVLFN